MSKFPLIVIAASAASFLAGGGHSLLPGLGESLEAQLSPACDIKGNIAIDSGEKIYHVPGQFYYQQTRISPEYGERWFCSEEDARAAGWRRSKR
ncbi:hypothetical protein [Neorhizobium sp. NCHU2750]|uniref:sunset domain-containing protein n=1 Tax=Neorhizobium sp. NCHU2750 TaxID=1825976 RepID=UPI000E71B81F|nr:hypothetical protein NCHU2750_08980 [Neorhizobium sp. NCHU2750]